MRKMTFVALEEYLQENKMKPVINVPGVNEKGVSWWINEEGKYLHLVRMSDKKGRNKHYDVLVSIRSIDPEAHKKDRYVRINMEGTKLLHKVLASTFLDMNYQDRLDVHHKDFDRSHNVVSNLEVLTHGDHIRKHYAHKKAIKAI